MKVQSGVVEWQGASSVRCTADAGGVLNAVCSNFYCVVDVGEACLSVEVMIASKYLLDEQGSCNGCDQVASPTPHRAPDLSDTSVPLAFSGDALATNTVTHSILQLRNLFTEYCVPSSQMLKVKIMQPSLMKRSSSLLIAVTHSTGVSVPSSKLLLFSRVQ